MAHEQDKVIQFIRSPIDQQIDQFLPYFYQTDGGQLFVMDDDVLNHILKEMSKSPHSLISVMKQEDLLRYRADMQGVLYEDNPRITLKGIRIIQKGGWLKYLDEQNREKTLALSQMESTIDANKISGDTIKELKLSNSNQRNLLYATIGIAAINMIIGIFTLFKTNEVYILPAKPQKTVQEPILPPQTSIPSVCDTLCDSSRLKN
jgi:hypothetical protein